MLPNATKQSFPPFSSPVWAYVPNSQGNRCHSARYKHRLLSLYRKGNTLLISFPYYCFDGFHSIVITASSLPLPLHTGQFVFTRSRCCSPQKKPLPWQYPHEWPLLVMVSFMLPPPINIGGIILIISFLTLIVSRFLFVKF